MITKQRVGGALCVGATLTVLGTRVWQVVCAPEMTETQMLREFWWVYFVGLVAVAVGVRLVTEET